MAQQGANDVCVIIDDCDLADDEPGPNRSVHKPAACAFEASWFGFPFHRPSDQVVNSSIPGEYLDRFKDFIWNRPHDRMVPGYGMTPKEIASVSSDGRKGWLVTSHFYWLSRCLNKQQDHTRFFVLDPLIRKASLEKILGGKSCLSVKRLIFVMSVGRQEDGVVFLGTDKMQGDHWSVAVVDIATGILSYCDTLGWPAPENIESCIIKYTNVLGLSQTKQLQMRMAHEPNFEQHTCSPGCTNYPLQTCSDVCGVVAVVCIAIAALDKDLFEVLMKPLNPNLNLYLTNPTEFAVYLRHVLIYWLASDRIDISRISLKPGFDPMATSGNLSQRPCMKRKLESLNYTDGADSPRPSSQNLPNTSNGSASNSPKRFFKNTPKMLNGNASRQTYKNKQIPGRKKLNINDYIVDAFETPLTFPELLSEVVELFGPGAKGQETESEIISNFYSNFKFNNSIERFKDDALSTKSYFKELSNFPTANPIILYKPQGKEMKMLHSTDSILVIQTPYQKEMMKSYGGKCICVDMIRKKEGDVFFLVTVSVFVEGIQEVPVAWLLCNRSDDHVLNLFFKTLRINVEDLQVEVFLGDMSSNFHKIWCQHFKRPGKKMFCIWDVLHVWNSRLDNLVPDINFRKKIKTYLSVLPQITDVKAFIAFKAALFDALKPNEEFLEYLKTKYFENGRDEQWASCYRHIPYSMRVPFLQPFSYTLRNVGFYRKSKLTRMDTSLHKLLQLIRFVENKLRIQPSQIQLQKALKEISARHREPCGDFDIFHSASGEEWHIRASEDTNPISIIDTGLNSCDCEIRCDVCKICVHQYLCSCANCLLMDGSCRHIHFVHSYRKMNSVINDPNSTTACSLEATTHSGFVETDIGNGQDLDTLRMEAKKKLDQLSHKIQETQDVEMLQGVCKALKMQENK